MEDQKCMDSWDVYFDKLIYKGTFYVYTIYLCKDGVLITCQILITSYQKTILVIKIDLLFQNAYNIFRKTEVS